MKGKMLTATAYPPPPPPPQSSPKKDSRKLIVVALLLVIIIVSAGVLFYLATKPSSTGSPTPTPTGTATPTPIGTATPTPTPSGGGANVAGASSLQYTVSVTNSSGASLGTWTYYAKNAGTSNLMIRIEFADPSSGGNFVYIINGALQQAWMESGGEWTDLSSAFASQWSSWNSTFTGYQNQLAGWAGVGDYTYTAGGDTVRIYDVAVNPSLADSLFQHS